MLRVPPLSCALGTLTERIMSTDRCSPDPRGPFRLPARFGLLVLVIFPALLACGDDGWTPTLAPAPSNNHRPVIRAQSDRVCAVGDTLRVQAVAADPDGDSLSYSASVRYSGIEHHLGYLPTGGMDAHTGWFWFVPASYDAPYRVVDFIVDDGNGGRDSTQFWVLVP